MGRIARRRLRLVALAAPLLALTCLPPAAAKLPRDPRPRATGAGAHAHDARGTARFDFEHDAAGWDLAPEVWQRAPVAGGWALQAVGEGTARPVGAAGSVSRLRFRLLIREPGSELVVLVGDHGVSLSAGGASALRSDPASGTQDLGASFYSITPGAFHDVDLRAAGHSLDLFVDNEPVVGVDLPSPISGGVTFSSRGDAWLFVDDVRLSRRLDEPSRAHAPRPPLAMAPGHDVGPFAGGVLAGPLALSGTDAITLSRGLYTVRGPVTLEGSARLTVGRGAALHVDSSTGGQGGGIAVRGAARFELSGGALVASDPEFGIHAFDDATVLIRDARPAAQVIECGGRSHVTLRGSRVVTPEAGRISVAESATVEIEHSRVGAISVAFPPGARAHVAGLRPGSTASGFDLQRDWLAEDLALNLRLADTTVEEGGSEAGDAERGWILQADEDAAVTIEDSILGSFILDFAPLGGDVLLSGLRLDAPATLRQGSVALEDVLVRSRWGVRLRGTRRGVLERCEGVLLRLEDQADILLRDTTLSDFRPRGFRGAVAFEEGRWTGAGAILDGNDFVVSGSLRPVPGAAAPYSWNDSVISRDVPILLLDAEGRPAAGVTATFFRPPANVEATTDAAGRAEARLRYSDAEKARISRLSTSAGHRTAYFHFPAATPMILQAPGTTFDPAILPDFASGDPYLDSYETGLYPGGAAVLPAGHRLAGESLAAGIRPLDPLGFPDDSSGRILALAFGHSNAEIYFQAMQAHLQSRAAEVNPRFEILNAAAGGQLIRQIAEPGSLVWQRARDLVSRPGYSSLQVQVLFLHTTAHGSNNARVDPPEPFPESAQRMQDDLAAVLALAARIYPNLKVAWLTSDGLRQHTGFEPHVWQEAFAVKWLIGDQIAGRSGTGFAGPLRRLPWLAWGPYIWDRSWDSSWFYDGVHPAEKARAAFVRAYWDLLANDSVARSWLLRP